MSNVFISHVEEDGDVALEIAQGLEAAGYTTWYYERDSQVGSLYLLQVGQAIERSRAVVLIISSDSLASNQVTNEVVRAYESDKPFLPVLRDITHPQFQQRQTLWRQALGATVAINLPPEGVPAILPRLMDGLRALGIQPKSKEEREAEAREQERAKKVVGLLTKAGEARSAEKWDEAITLLKEALELAPNDEAVQGRLRGVQKQQRESQLSALRARARSLAEAEEWDEALSTWREVLALEPEDREGAEARIQQVEKLREMAQAYDQAQAAMARKDYDQATELLQGLVVQDPSYKDAARLLAKAVELRRIGGRPKPSRWLWGAVATVALVAVALVVTQVLPRLAPSGQETTPVFTQAVADATAVGPAPDDTPMLSETDAATATSQVESAATATSTFFSQKSKPESATATHTLAPTAPVTPESPTVSTAASPTPSDTAASQSVLVPDEVVGQFFSPGPAPAALAVVGDVLWVINDEPRMLHQLDRTGTPLASFPITPTDTIRGLVWDGENLRLALSSYRDNQVVRLGPAGQVLESLPLPIASVGLGWNPDNRTFWTVSGEFLLEFDTDGRLLQTLHAPVFGGPAALTWAPEGLWVVDVFGTWYCFDFAGEKLSDVRLPVETFGSNMALTWDERDYLWLTVQHDHQIYQLSLRQKEVRLVTAATPGKGGELTLPRPQLKPASIADKAIIHVTNNLQGTVSLSFGDESAILKPGETWSTELSEGVYTVFASASQPEPIAFSDEQLLVAGYDWTWVLDRPE